jgi:transcriptional regulator with XRE-family HTH domain
MAETKDFNLTLKLRNNHLVERRERLGLSAPKFADAVGVSYGCYLDYENMKAQPFHPQTGQVNRSAQKIADYLGETIPVLWPEAVRVVKQYKIERTISASEMSLLIGQSTQRRALLLEDVVYRRELATMTLQAVDKLNPREKHVIERRFGLTGEGSETYEEIGKNMLGPGGVGRVSVKRERVRQIEAMALRKLRHYSKSKKIRDALGLQEYDVLRNLGWSKVAIEHLKRREESQRAAAEERQ